MPANRYEFRDQWHISRPIEEVWNVLARTSKYPEWWKGVYLDAKPVGRVKEPAVGASAAVVVKGWLPYKVRATFEATRLEPPTLIEFKASGDFRTDSSRWVLREVEGGTNVTLEWNPIVDKLIIKLLSPIAKPLFRSNHAWTMRLGEKRLNEYLKSHNARV